MGLIHCYKTATFTFMFAVFLLKLLESFRQIVSAVTAERL